MIIHTHGLFNPWPLSTCFRVSMATRPNAIATLTGQGGVQRTVDGGRNSRKAVCLPEKRRFSQPDFSSLAVRPDSFVSCGEHSEFQRPAEFLMILTTSSLFHHHWRLLGISIFLRQPMLCYLPSKLGDIFHLTCVATGHSVVHLSLSLHCIPSSNSILLFIVFHKSHFSRRPQCLFFSFLDDILPSCFLGRITLS